MFLNLRGLLAFVGSCGELWAELGFGGCGFGFWACFLGLKVPILRENVR